MLTQLEEYRERERREASLKDLNGLLLKEGEAEGVRKESAGERKKLNNWVKEMREFVPVSLEQTLELVEKKMDGGGLKRGVKVEEGEGKRRCVGEEFGGDGFDPKSWRGNWNPVMVKVNGVVWDDGIGRVLGGSRL
ncbi:hypothetical protein HOY82DRAFT_618370 [Tuber indicum]|nr:hypothetical protein HOY82DRAFT_618370 [Tuber indicum]